MEDIALSRIWAQFRVKMFLDELITFRTLIVTQEGFLVQPI